MKRWVIFFFILIYCPDAAWALTATAHVDRTRIRTSESIGLSVVIEGNGGDVDISGITDFKVLSKSSSTRIRIENFDRKAETTYTYTLVPLKSGKLKIPAMGVRSGKDKVKTREIAIAVSEAPVTRGGKNDVWVAAAISKKNPYQGQQIIYTFKLFHAVRITDAKYERPAFKGFTAKQIEQERAYETVVSGKRYRVIELKFVLVPVEEGRHVIEPAVLACSVVKENERSRRGFGPFFDDPFFGRSRLVPGTFRTEAMAVDVKPLPSYGPDGGFSGLVGRFAFSAELDGREMAVGDSATLSLTVSGEGNIMDAGEPVIRISDRFKVYRDNPEEDIRIGENGYSGKKVFRLALVPIQDGRSDVGPFAFNWFDPDTGQYKKIKTKSFAVEVHPAEGEEQKEAVSGDRPGQPPEFKKKKVEFIDRDILPLKEGLDALLTRREMSLPFFMLLLLIPVILYGAGRIIHGVVHKDEDEATQMARRARAAIKDAEQNTNDDGIYLSGLYAAIVSLVMSVANAKGETLTCKEVEDILGKHAIPVETRRRTMDFLNNIESYRYGGQVLDAGLKKHLLSEIRILVRRLS